MKTFATSRLYKACIVTVALFATATHVNAQFAFSAGPKGGFAISNLKGTNSTNFDSRTSWFYGVFTNFQIGKVLSIQPEFLLTERGAKFDAGNSRSEVSIKYFEVPVLAKIRLPLANEVIFPHILVGPDFAFRTDVDVTSTGSQSGGSVSVNKGDIRKSNVGGLAGAGIDIQTQGSGIFFTIDGRYGWSFQDLNDNDNTIALKHRGWMFSAGVGFRIGNSSNDVDK